jgi:hypothetical protein
VTGSSEDLAVRWRSLFHEADNLDPEAPAEEKRRRGRVFEKILLGMLSEDRLEPRIRVPADRRGDRWLLLPQGPGVPA